MFGSNAHYGHRSILTQYAGVPEPKPIPGLVQHGWNYDLGAILDDVRLPAPEPFYLWSERNLSACKRAGLDHVIAIGAPFLYLPALEQPVETVPRSLLVMPMHGWERQQLDHDFDLYAKLLSDLRPEFSRITVCLYWLEHAQARYRRPFEEGGFSVVTVGQRDKNPRFLYDLRRLLLEHEYVCSNRAQTGGFYALHLGRKFFLFGPPVGVEAKVDRTGMLFDAWQRREYPQLAWQGFKDVAYRDVGADELGVPFVREPEALRETFLWNPHQAAAHEAKRRANGRRIGERRRRATRERWRTRLGWIPLVGRVFGDEDERS